MFSWKETKKQNKNHSTQWRVNSHFYNSLKVGWKTLDYLNEICLVILKLFLYCYLKQEKSWSGRQVCEFPTIRWWRHIQACRSSSRSFGYYYDFFIWRFKNVIKHKGERTKLNTVQIRMPATWGMRSCLWNIYVVATERINLFWIRPQYTRLMRGR